MQSVYGRTSPIAACVCDWTGTAAGQGHLDVMRFLLSNGADQSLVDSADDTARDVAVRFRQLAASDFSLQTQVITTARVLASQAEAIVDR